MVDEAAVDVGAVVDVSAVKGVGRESERLADTPETCTGFRVTAYRETPAKPGPNKGIIVSAAGRQRDTDSSCLQCALQCLGCI